MGGVVLFVGGTPFKGGSLSELPNTAFLNEILTRNRSFGDVFFPPFLASEIAKWQRHSCEVDEE